MAAIQDLADKHHLVTNLFKLPKSLEEWNEYRLTEEQVAHFHEYGYVSGIKMLTEDQVAVLRNELEEIRDPKHPAHKLFYEFHSNQSTDPNTVLFHSLGHWRIASGFHDLLWNPAFTMAASQLLGNKRVRFWHDQLFCKPARHGGVVAWHQDYSFWTRTVPMQHLSCWTGLDDAHAENGCLYYVPKSHRWGLLEKPELAGSMNGLIDFLTDTQKAEFKPIPIELEKGYATFHHPLMVHGSYENKSHVSRRALVINVFADGTISDTNGELLGGGASIKVGKGAKLEGKFFPILFD